MVYGILASTLANNGRPKVGCMLRARNIGRRVRCVCSAFSCRSILTLEIGLMATMDEHASSGFQIGYPLLSGIGIGMLFHAPYQLFTSVLPADQLGSGTSAFFLVRFTGATVGLVSARLNRTASNSIDAASNSLSEAPYSTIDYRLAHPRASSSRAATLPRDGPRSALYSHQDSVPTS